MKWLVFFISMTVLADAPKTKKKDSLLELDRQLSDELRIQKLDEKKPPVTLPNDREEEPQAYVETECQGGDPERCVMKPKPKKVYRPDGLQVK